MSQKNFEVSKWENPGQGIFGFMRCGYYSNTEKKYMKNKCKHPEKNDVFDSGDDLWVFPENTYESKHQDVRYLYTICAICKERTSQDFVSYDF